MKPGLTIGQTATLEVTVTTEMLANFGGENVHHLYATSALVLHMEWVCRKMIEPYIEEHEEGIGYRVKVSHLMPTIPHMTVKLKATIADIKDRKVTCDVEAFNLRGKIARGCVVQAIVEKSWLNHKIKELTLVHHLSKEAAEQPH